MIIVDNAGNFVPAGRMARTRSTDFWDGSVPPWVVVTDGTPSASTRTAGGLALTGPRLRFEAQEIALSDIPVPPEEEGARRVRMDLHFTGGAVGGELAAFGLQGASGSVTLEKASAGGGAHLRLISKVADPTWTTTANYGTNTEIGHDVNDLNQHKRYHLALIYDPRDRGFYLFEDGSQDVAHFTAAELVNAPMTPFVEIWSDNGAAITKDFHQFTVTTEWL